MKYISGKLSVAIALCFYTSAYAAEPTDTTRLKEVFVTAPAKTNVELLPLNVTTLTASQINQSAEFSLLPILTDNVTGLFVTERGFAGYGVSTGAAGNVNIRGIGQGNQVLFLIDGQPQWAGLFGHSLPDTYVANGVERVEIVKGPSSILYGSNAMGGSINIITSRRHTDGYFGRARAAFGSFTTQKFDLSTGFRKGKFGGTAAAQLYRSNGYQEHSAFWEANELLQLQYSPDSHWDTGATLDMTQSRAENPGTTQAPLLDMWTRIFRGTASVWAKNRYEISEGGVQAFINWGTHKVDDGHAPDSAPTDYLFHSTDYNMGFTIYQTLRLWRENDLSAGIDFLHWGGHAWNTDKTSGEKDEIVKACENEIAGYLMMQQGLAGDLITLNAGVRLQHGSSYGNVWVPQAGFILRPLAGSSVKFSFSKGFRAPNIRELYMYPPHNPGLKPEYLYNYEVELRRSVLNGRLNLGVALFFINAKDMIQRVMINGRPKNENTGSFINKGIEVDASWRIASDWNLRCGYSYLHTSSATLLGAPKNKLNASLSYSPDRLELTLASNSVWSLRNGAADGSTESYSLLDLRAAYSFGTHRNIKPYVKIDNLTNKHYEIVYGCPMPGTTILGGVELSF